MATLISAALSIFTFEIILRNTLYIRDSSTILISIILAFATVAMPFGIALYAARAAFRRRAAMEGLLVIFSGYMAVLISFAGVYYSFNVISDYHEARDIADFYVHAATHLDNGSLQKLPQRVRDEKAFSGMRHSTWTSLADEARPAFWHPSAQVSEGLMLQAARRHGPWQEGSSKDNTPFQPAFRPEERLPSLLQCLHFSVVTMATVGYGDVNPHKWYSQVAVDMQILIGQILVVFALGCVLGKWWDYDEGDGERAGWRPSRPRRINRRRPPN
ncbi:MAG: potassium channel family protein [Cyanobacteriota bacterium]|nr:potassium channel family protein [Cyanobacteriota bacterium]